METRSTASRTAASSWLRRPQTWVLVVTVLYVLLQLLLLDSRRFLTWDEAVYTSQVSPFATAVSMGAHRARGITLMVAPIAVFTDSMQPLRIYLALLSGAGLFAAFVTWCQSIRWSAPIAAGMFATGWVTIFYGSAVYPNLYLALIAVAAFGLTLRATDPEKRTDLYLLVALLAMAVLIRPLEAAIIGVSVAVVAPLQNRNRWRALSVAAVVGLAVGSVPWLIEAWARFDGPLHRLTAAGDAVGSGLHNNITDYLRSLDGSAGAVNRWAILWLALLLLLGLTGLFGPNVKLRRISAISLGAAFLFAAPYLFVTGAIAQRFMLPALALVCIGSALGITTLVVRFDGRAVVTISLAVTILVFTAWNYRALRSWDERQVRNGNTALALGESVKAHAGLDQCFFLSAFNYPAISFESGCAGGLLSDDPGQNQRRFSAAGDQVALFALTPDADVSEILGDGWRCEPVAALAERGWQICSGAY